MDKTQFSAKSSFFFVLRIFTIPSFSNLPTTKETGEHKKIYIEMFEKKSVPIMINTNKEKINRLAKIGPCFLEAQYS